MPPLERRDAADLVRRRHSEWREFAVPWQRLMDALEGGDRYRYATYGTDQRGYPKRNLTRHKHEYPGLDASGVVIEGTPRWHGDTDTTDDDYTLRLVRTPVPDWVGEAVRKSLARIYSREPKREGPAPYVAWLDDVDGSGAAIGHWMRHRLAPLLLALGNVDVLVERPRPPAPGSVTTRADVERLRLNRAVASVILPQQVVWWELGPDRTYRQVLVLEEGDPNHGPGSDDDARYRHWTPERWDVYDGAGEWVEGSDHAYGIVPIRRFFAARKLRCENVGQSTVDATADLAREFYNRDSEMVLSDTLQAHPTLQGPVDPGRADTPVGPSWLLPMVKSGAATNITWQGYEFVEPPKNASDSLRINEGLIRDRSDRSQSLVKPAGAATLEGVGGSGTVVGQSGLSKSFDHRERNEVLAEQAESLADAETHLGRLVLAVLGIAGQVSVSYSKQFDLVEPAELTAWWAETVQLMKDGSGTPEATIRVVMLGVRDNLSGLSDDEYRAIEAECLAFMAKREEEAEESRAALAMANAAGPGGGADPFAPADDDDDDDDEP